MVIQIFNSNANAIAIDVPPAYAQTIGTIDVDGAPNSVTIVVRHRVRVSAG